jgi:hypothetical protein
MFSGEPLPDKEESKTLRVGLISQMEMAKSRNQFSYHQVKNGQSPDDIASYQMVASRTSEVRVQRAMKSKDYPEFPRPVS